MKYIICICFALCAMHGYSQREESVSSFIEIDEQWILDRETENTTFINFAVSNNSNEIGICLYNKYKKSDTVEFAVLNTDNDSITYEAYHINKLRRDFKLNYSEVFCDISISKKYIHILTFNELYQLNRQTGEAERIVKEEFEHVYNILDIGVDDILYYHRINQYIKHDDVGELAVWNKLDDSNTKIEFKFEHRKYAAIWPRHFVDYYSGKFLLTQTIDYNIKIYDTLMNYVDEFSLNGEYNWRQLDDKNASKPTFQNLNFIDRLSNAYWLSDECILVCVMRGIGEGDTFSSVKVKQHIDIWKKKNGKWEMIHSRLEDEKIDPNIHDSHHHNLFSQILRHNYIIHNNYIYNIGFAAPVNIKDCNAKDYLDRSDEYYYDNEPRMQIVRLKHSFDQ